MDDLDYFFNRQSLHLSVCSLPQRSTQLRADIYYDIQISLSIIHPSVCLSDWLLSVPLPQGGGGERVDCSLSIYRYTDCSVHRQSVHLCLSAPLGGGLDI